jgi:hypothetical protein
MIIDNIKCFGKRAIFKVKDIFGGMNAKGDLNIGQFGPIFTEFSGKPKEAIEHLLKVQNGEVPAAIHHKDIGDIDIVWGNEKVGLKHIYDRRLEQWKDKDKVIRFIKHLPEIISEGIVDATRSTATKKILVTPRSMAVIELKFNGKDKTWLLTAYVNDRNRNNPLFSLVDGEQINSGAGSHDLDKSNGLILSAVVANDIIPQTKWQNQMDRFFGWLGDKIGRADTKLMETAQNKIWPKLPDRLITVEKTMSDIFSMADDFKKAASQIYEQANSRKDTLGKLLNKDESVMLSRALGGDLDPKELPSHLTNLYNNVRKMLDDNAQALIEAGALDKKYQIQDYLKRFYADHLEQQNGDLKKYFDKRFKARKDLTHDERLALGMIEDSDIVIPATLAAQRTQLLKANFLKQVADKYGVDDALDGYVRMSDETVGGGIKKFGALGGKYVPKEIARAIKDANVLREELGALEKLIYPLVDHIKVNVTVKNPTTHLYNFGSNFLLSYLHGDMIALGRVLNMKATNKARWDSLMKRAHEQGIVSHLGDMEDIFRMPNLDKKEPMSVTILKNIYMAKGSKSGEFMRNAYGWGDLIFKIAHFDRLTKMGVSDSVAAKAAKEAYVDYSKPLPGLVKGLDKSGIVPFLGYTYRSTPMVLKTIAKHPFKFAVMQAALIGAGGSAWLGDNDRKNAYKPKWAGNKWYTNAFGIDSWIRVNDGWYVNAGRLVPAFRLDGFDSLEFQGGFLMGIGNILSGKTPLGYKISKESDSTSSKIFARAKEAAKNYLPPLTLGRYLQQTVGYFSGLDVPKNYYNEDMKPAEIYSRAFGARRFNEKQEAKAKVTSIKNKYDEKLKNADNYKEKQEIKKEYKWELERVQKYANETPSKFNLDLF